MKNRRQPRTSAPDLLPDRGPMPRHEARRPLPPSKWSAPPALRAAGVVSIVSVGVDLGRVGSAPPT